MSGGINGATGPDYGGSYQQAINEDVRTQFEEIITDALSDGPLNASDLMGYISRDERTRPTVREYSVNVLHYIEFVIISLKKRGKLRERDGLYSLTG